MHEHEPPRKPRVVLGLAQRDLHEQHREEGEGAREEPRTNTKVVEKIAVKNAWAATESTGFPSRRMSELSPA